MTKTASGTAESAALLAILIAAGLLPGVPSAAAATDAPRCSPVPAGAAPEDPAKLPPEVAAAVRRELGDLALPGEPFNATDVVEPGAKSRRILFVWRRAERWVVATERGGRGTSNPVLALDREEGRATVVAGRTVFPDRLCETAAALLN